MLLTYKEDQYYKLCVTLASKIRQLEGSGSSYSDKRYTDSSYSGTSYCDIIGLLLGLGYLGTGINCIFGYGGPKPLRYRLTVRMQYCCGNNVTFFGVAADV